MRIEVLVSTMNQNDMSLFQKMNIQSDAIIINQTDKNDYKEEYINGNRVRMYSFNEIGVGLSRNNALMRSDAEICLMADDDMVYIAGYEKIIIKNFKKRKNADMIVFNVPIHKKNGATRVKVKRNARVRFFNGLKYGTVNFAFKRKAILKKNICFSLLFGGGTVYSSGEDSIFIADVIKNKLKIYSCTSVIANITEGSSTWFRGYNAKYLYDRGALFKVIGGKLSLMFILQFVIRHKKKYSKEYDFFEAFKIMIKGSKDYYSKEEGY